MRVRLLYFAGIRDLLGLGEETLELPEGYARLSDVTSALIRAHPEVESRLDSVRFAVNEAFAEDDATVGDGDTVAVIPPVSGG